MTVLITGAHGFIGHYVSRHLAKLGRKAIGLGHGAWVESDYRHWGLEDWMNGEVSHANLDVLAEKHGVPEAVIHLAGGSAVGPSIAAPAEDFRRTVDGTSNVAEWIRRHAPTSPLVMASSAAVYGSGHMGEITEQVVCTPFSPYGFNKRMAELVLESYAQSFGLHVASARLFSVYGPGLRKQLLWDTCTKLSAAPDCLTLGGYGNELRDWVHVEDAARLLVLAIEHASESFPVVNCASGIATSVSAIAARLIECWESGAKLAFNTFSRKGDPQSLVGNPSLAASWGWTPEIAWQFGLAEYVAWFREDGQLK